MITKLISFLFIILLSTSSIQATSPQSDYEYQLTQYRKHNTEFKVLKEDNQKNPTLDNQQKALQAAKQTIISRDTTKIVYIEVILSSIRSQNPTQGYILQTESELISAQEFYKNQIILAKNIVSVEDLTKFTKEYLATQPPYQTEIIKSLATNKLAILIRLQTDIKNAYDDLLPKISDKTLTPVSAGLDKITQLADNINNKILSSINIIKSSEVTTSSKSSFYSKQTENLSQIKTLQVELVNILVDLEKNYVN
ncbi:hypothetical protein KKG65_03535 [Patescibacteria group bacterium]|nr:hypothetical protein [Patescibacteria group bacterium]